MPNLMQMTPEQLAKAVEIAAIAQQNDAFRRMPVMHPSVGRWVMTAAICAEGETFCEEVIAAVRDFDSFTEEMDPTASTRWAGSRFRARRSGGRSTRMRKLHCQQSSSVRRLRLSSISLRTIPAA